MTLKKSNTKIKDRLSLPPNRKLSEGYCDKLFKLNEKL